MAIVSSIEWTEATWNPVTGCSKISAGCANCYAERMARRLKAMGLPNYSRSFEVALHEERKVAFFFKQWGGTNRKKRGRLLEGRLWDEILKDVKLSSTRWRASMRPRTSAGTSGRSPSDASGSRLGSGVSRMKEII